MSGEKIKCLGKDRNNDYCRNNRIDGTRFCKFHEYLSEYSDDMLNNLTLCSGCKKMYYLVGTKSCDKCKNRGNLNRIKDKEEKQEKVLCKKDGCKYEKSEENEYCGKHQTDYFKDQTELENKKVCYNYTRGCREKLDLTYKYSKCQPCLEKDRIKDKARYNANKEINLIKEVKEVEEVKEVKEVKKSKIEANIDNIVDAVNDLDKIILEQEDDIKNEYNKYKIKKIKLEGSDKEVPVFLCPNKYHWKQGKDYIDENNKCFKQCNQCRERSRIKDKQAKINNLVEVVKKEDDSSDNESIESIDSLESVKNETESEIKLQITRNKNSEKKQRHRERLKEELGEEEYKRINAEKMREYRQSKVNENKVEVVNKIKKTPEQIKEEARLRKQKSREKLKEKFGEEEYKKLRANEIAEYRKKMTSNKLDDDIK